MYSMWTWMLSKYVLNWSIWRDWYSTLCWVRIYCFWLVSPHFFMWVLSVYLEKNPLPHIEQISVRIFACLIKCWSSRYFFVNPFLQCWHFNLYEPVCCAMSWNWRFCLVEKALPHLPQMKRFVADDARGLAVPPLTFAADITLYWMSSVNTFCCVSPATENNTGLY